MFSTGKSSFSNEKVSQSQLFADMYYKSIRHDLQQFCVSTAILRF